MIEIGIFILFHGLNKWGFLAFKSNYTFHQHKTLKYKFTSSYSNLTIILFCIQQSSYKVSQWMSLNTKKEICQIYDVDIALRNDEL